MTSEGRSPAEDAWQLMSDLVLAHDRKVAAAEELGLSFARIRALRRLVGGPLTLRALAAALTADPPYVTLIVRDLEAAGLVETAPHPTDRRAKQVALTGAGRATAAQADRIMRAPPAGLASLPPEDLERLAELLRRAATG